MGTPAPQWHATHPDAVTSTREGIDCTGGDLQEHGRRNMQQLAEASAGRLFEVQSPSDLDGVFAKVAEDLRSVYSIGYYPDNQNFNGAWREIRLRVKRSGVILRTRPGYYAW